MMKDSLERILEGPEEDFDTSLGYRMGKVVVVGLAVTLFGWIVEKQYDRTYVQHQERKYNNVES